MRPAVRHATLEIGSAPTPILNDAQCTPSPETMCVIRLPSPDGGLIDSLESFGLRNLDTRTWGGAFELGLVTKKSDENAPNRLHA
jgi:hypothetical protein